ncbi:MAG TPA: hypothetical protein VFY05_05140, partial [Candidatus Angelobacter sp.]|nr:hypothetical protein [Candidatus Angelobacter sp.]
MVAKKGFDLPSFENSFSLNKIPTLIEYTGFANFSMLSIRLTASGVSISLHDRRTPIRVPAANFGHQGILKLLPGIRVS